MVIDVKIVSPAKVLFKGQAQSVIVPGEKGVFEILPFHKRILSRLVSGVLIVDDWSLAIARGIIQAAVNKVVIVVEET